MSFMKDPKAGAEGPKIEPGASWKVDEKHTLPKNRLPIVCDRVDESLWPFYSSRQVISGLMATIFLAALDEVRLQLRLLFF